MNLTREHIRAIIYYNYSRKMRPSECHKEITVILGKAAASKSTVEKWYQSFRSRAASIQDKPHSGRPSKVKEDDVLAAIGEDRHLTTRELSVMLAVSKSCIYDTLCRMNLTYKFNRWVPHVLTLRNKQDRVRICNQLIAQHKELQFFDRMITCDEKWIYYENTGRTGEWSGVGQAPSSVAKRALTNKKILLCVWWDRAGVIYKEYLKSGQTMDSEVYCRMLMNVQDQLLKNRRRLVTMKGVLFHQDNARPHVSSETKNFLKELGWDLMAHPPWSPDIAPSDYYLFSNLQLHLKGAIFNSAEEAICGVDDFFNSRSDHFWAKGIEKLPKRWAKIVETGGDYYPH